MDIDLTGYRFVPAPYGSRKFRQKVYLKRKFLGIISDQRATLSYKRPDRVNKYYATSNIKDSSRKTKEVTYKEVPGASRCDSLEEAFIKLVMYHLQNGGLDV